MKPDTVATLQGGPSRAFRDWPDNTIPPVAAGVYTVWEGQRFIYVGMSGRGGTQADIERKLAAGETKKGLYSRLNSHASGRRSGDQFCVYICDRFVVPRLSPDQLASLGNGELLDEMTREYIRSHLSYRYVVVEDGKAALSLEREVQEGALSAGKPLLNPR